MPDRTGPAQNEFSLPAHIQRGDMAPWWKQGAHKFIFDQSAGRYIVLGFFGNGAEELNRATLGAMLALGRANSGDQIHFYCVSRKTGEHRKAALLQEFPAIRFVWDEDDVMHRAYGVAGHGTWIVLSPMLRVIEVIPLRADGNSVEQLTTLIAGLPPPATFAGIELPAPVLIVPDCFEPAFCNHLISQYQSGGGRESGYMQEVRGQVVEQYDPAWKRRKDHYVADPSLIDQIKTRMARRLGHMLNQAFHFKLTRMERFVIGCYTAQDGGHFGPHRDDTIRATVHRRFAVSINLNSDFDGGELSFPEFGARTFKAPVGAAVVFSSSLLHRVGNVTRGQRYAFLPFLHDEEAERTRVENLRLQNTTKS
jgi:predicted 2-oxoglutarate/Fe(II)-dependent dioxygenase YbiX